MDIGRDSGHRFLKIVDQIFYVRICFAALIGADSPQFRGFDRVDLRGCRANFADGV